MNEKQQAPRTVNDLMRHVLGHTISGRTIKRLARLAGTRLKRGRAPTPPRVHNKDLDDLIKITSGGLAAFNDNALHFLNQVNLGFGLSPRQYLKWATQFVRRGKYMMRNVSNATIFSPPLILVKGTASVAA